jgi:hypothetical protein
VSKQGKEPGIVQKSSTELEQSNGGAHRQAQGLLAAEERIMHVA